MGSVLLAFEREKCIWQYQLASPCSIKGLKYTDPFLWNNNFRVSVWQISGYLGLGGQIICSTLIVCHALFSDKEDYQKTFLQCIQSVFMKIHNFSFWHVMKITILTSSGMACLNDKLTHYLSEFSKYDLIYKFWDLFVLT